MITLTYVLVEPSFSCRGRSPRYESIMKVLYSLRFRVLSRFPKLETSDGREISVFYSLIEYLFGFIMNQSEFIGHWANIRWLFAIGVVKISTTILNELSGV